MGVSESGGKDSTDEGGLLRGEAFVGGEGFGVAVGGFVGAVVGVGGGGATGTSKPNKNSLSAK